MQYSAVQYVRKYETCQQFKVDQNKLARFMGVRTVEGPWTTVAMDIIGPQPRSKNGAVYALKISSITRPFYEVGGDSSAEKSHT